ncbi:tRNA (adenosine(37)-N6)-threonylcarbamoyltransferase complex ATPase subunit type 1 TsaE [Cesiribacter sp. SM1]|uniref:tRNA (adenosine(37)-N6)-threonylcarbamoyltransferase complex ATPase subunit type 1 TsaE n=1 Tax=Cesiribacter sp. SM1 TaxID=2861196 RepID=UPI001CD62069|nr:tRNA (adenosine(37)-N6)-threonylcarbamoyltransferase complex ATPase subunit type 1 TsaE [Cesiribacter sp. SM1]
MKQKVWQGVTLDRLPGVAAEVLSLLNGAPTVWQFDGPMGAGKTTFIKQLCRDLGVQDVVQSPTFSLVNEYQTQEGDTIYHFDFYRINSPEEAHQIGVTEYLDSGYICLIEWPERIQSLLPEENVQILLHPHPDNSRTIEVKIHGTTD